MDTIRSTIAVPSCGDHHQRRWFATETGIDSVCKLAQLRCCCIDDMGRGAEFYFAGTPATIRRADYGVHFQARVVTIVMHCPTKSLAVYPQITNDHGFKQQTRGLQVFHQVFRCCAKSRHGQRWIDEVELATLTHTRPGTQMNSPRRLQFYEQQPFKCIDVTGNGFEVECSRKAGNIRSNGRELQLAGDVPRQCFEDSLNAFGIPLDAIHCVDIGTENVLHVVLHGLPGGSGAQGD